MNKTKFYGLIILTIIALSTSFYIKDSKMILLGVLAIGCVLYTHHVTKNEPKVERVIKNEN